MDYGVVKERRYTGFRDPIGELKLYNGKRRWPTPSQKKLLVALYSNPEMKLNGYQKRTLKGLIRRKLYNNRGVNAGLTNEGKRLAKAYVNAD